MKDMQASVKLGLQERFWEVFVEGSCFTGRFLRVVWNSNFELGIFMRNAASHVRTELETLNSNLEWRIGKEGCSDSLPLHHVRRQGLKTFDGFSLWNRHETTMTTVLTFPTTGFALRDFRFSDDKTKVILCASGPVGHHRHTVGHHRHRKVPRSKPKQNYYLYDNAGNKLILHEDDSALRDIYCAGNFLFDFEFRENHFTCTRFSIGGGLTLTDKTEKTVSGDARKVRFFHENSLKFYYWQHPPLEECELFVFDCQTLTAKSLGLKFEQIRNIHVQGEMLALDIVHQAKQEVRVFHLSNIKQDSSFWNIPIDFPVSCMKIYQDKIYIEHTHRCIEFVKDSRVEPLPHP